MGIIPHHKMDEYLDSELAKRKGSSGSGRGKGSSGKSGKSKPPKTYGYKDGSSSTRMPATWYCSSELTNVDTGGCCNAVGGTLSGNTCTVIQGSPDAPLDKVRDSWTGCVGKSARGLSSGSLCYEAQASGVPRSASAHSKAAAAAGAAYIAYRFSKK